MLNLNKNKLIPAIEISTSWGEIKGDISKQTDLVELTTDLDTSIKGWVESKGYVTAETLPEGIATESWVQSQGYLTEHQDLSSYALKTEVPSLDGYATESWVTSQGYLTEHQDLSDYALKTEIPSLNGYATESWVEEINNTKENKKPVFYIDVDFDGPSVMTSYADYMSIGAQIKQLGADNVVLYVRDRSGYICMPDVIDVGSQNYMTITGMAYTNNYKISNDSSSLFISFSSFVGYTQLNNNINDVKAWVVNQKYAKKSELKTINGQSIVGSGNITIQATGGVTEEWLQNNMKTINGVSVVGPGDLFVPEPVYIVIDLDSEEFIGTYDDYKEVASKYFNNYETLKLIVNFESPSTGVFGDSYPSDVYSPTEGKIEIGGYFLDERDENNKRLVYYRIKGNDVTQKVEVSFTPVSSGDMPSLDGYATQEWVNNQLTNYTTNSDFTSLQNRVVALETNYGDALNITNQILDSMSELTTNLNNILDIKGNIKSAIENKGVDMTGVSFPGYASKIGEISGGGGWDQKSFTEEVIEIINLDNSASFVASRAFMNNNTIQTVNLPYATSVGSEAFFQCNALRQVSLPVCSYIGKSAFAYCQNLNQISLPVCSYISSQAFHYCTVLRQVSLPVCSYIGDGAFDICSRLSIITIGYSGICSLYNTKVFNDTQITSSTGSIYVPASLVDTYKSAQNWSYFSTQIFPIE